MREMTGMKNFCGVTRVEQRGRAMVAPPIAPPTLVVLLTSSFLAPSPFTLHGAAGTFSRLASRQRTHVILTSGERRLQPSPQGRRGDPSVEDCRARRFWASGALFPEVIEISVQNVTFVKD